MKDVKAIRVGDKIIVFINGKRETISKNVSPEVFDMVLNFIRNDEVNKIENIFTSLENNLDEYLKEFFVIKNGFLYKKSNEEKVVYSKLIIRKSVELMGMNIEPKPLLKLVNKLSYKTQISNKGIDLFKKLNKIILTEEGNLILHSNISGISIKDKNKVIGYPIGVNENVITHDNSQLYSVSLNEIDTNTLILINPFDISSFTNSSINVSRFKIIDTKLEGELKPIMKIKNEKLFDISFDLFNKKNK
jgi:hypothetical protein